MRLINVAPMLEQLDLEHYDKDWYVSQYNADWISSWLESQPVIEAEPVKHGRWEHIRMLTTGDGRVKVGDCSSCKSTEKVRNYCPNCGCKMDLEG